MQVVYHVLHTSGRLVRRRSGLFIWNCSALMLPTTPWEKEYNWNRIFLKLKISFWNLNSVVLKYWILKTLIIQESSSLSLLFPSHYWACFSPYDSIDICIYRLKHFIMQLPLYSNVEDFGLIISTSFGSICLMFIFDINSIRKWFKNSIFEQMPAVKSIGTICDQTWKLLALFQVLIHIWL